jgi:murein DD-endopeptidase MepM/ murein hydrolase activator NlpD
VAVPPAPGMPNVAGPGRTPSPTGKLAAPFAVAAAFSSPIGVDHDRSSGRNDLDCRNYRGRPFPACYTLHEGSDFMMIGGFATMDAGSLDVIAAAAGVVKEIAEGNFDRCFFDPRQPDHINCQGGQPEVANFVDILQDDGLVARYFHLKKGTVLVRPTQRVECGQALGKVGSSGRSSAPHLHFELRRVGEIVDPYAEGMWISLDARNVPNGRCPGATAVTPPKAR